MNKKIIFSVMLVCLLAFGAVMAFSQSIPNVRWEYRVLTASGSSFSDNVPAMNSLGTEGWELVTISAMNGEMLFKRRLP